MISYTDALNIIMAEASPLPHTEIALTDAISMVLAEDIISSVQVPPFANSAMDGYALLAADTARDSAPSPIKLPISQSIPAGTDLLPKQLAPGTAAEIMTGAPVPPGADSVIPVEMTKRDNDTLILDAPYESERNVRAAGEDMKPGQIVARKGQCISAALVPTLCALGKGRFPVIPRPKAVWLSTGRELVDDLSAPLSPSQIYNSSGPYGESILPALGADMMWRRTVGDDGDSFREAMRDALRGDADVIISTGAVSVGKFDFVRAELEAMGATILLHRAKVKPGKPILFAKLPDGRHFFGLPGNPVSTAMGLRVFVAPFLRALSGQQPEPMIKATLKTTVKTTPRLTSFLKGNIGISEDGRLVATVLSGQESFRVAPMVDMNTWIVYPEGTENIEKGSLVDCIPFTPLEI
ncbi:molybdopterin molybdenumtransferase MoeA [Kordiimonas sediminis]|uniref:Molybdopterin molybdenumtransferase n=1 Tax=Kordiimonas sediminis TaxID=1735581 RepID=A0A919E584_9PROT|nr:gephyrin-like molybdotransferase Glp [Kordiimonas sediminis]GHF20560.1 molybdopterin molybdenumtransferase MoeA [Kordiimonas sediminis]